MDSAGVGEKNTVLEALQRWVATHPEKPCWTFLDDKGEAVDSYTYQVSR